MVYEPDEGESENETVQEEVGKLVSSIKEAREVMDLGSRAVKLAKKLLEFCFKFSLARRHFRLLFWIGPNSIVAERVGLAVVIIG